MSSLFDFSRSRSQPAWGWVLLGLGVIALFLASWFEQRVAAAQTVAIAAQHVRVEAERARLRPAPVVEPTASEKRVLAAAIDVHAPWLATLRSVETNTEAPIFLRAMAIDASTRSIKLEAEADTFEDALDYVKALGEEPLLAPALLVSHDQAVAALGKPVVRFTVSTRWNQL